MGAAESKLEFRKQVISLGERQTDLDGLSDQYWAAFYTLPEYPEDIFNLFAHKEVRGVLQENPEGMARLIRKLIHRIRIFLDRRQDANAKDTPTPTPIPPPQASKDNLEVLNCVRILTRVLPFIFELEDDNFENELFWNIVSPTSSTPKESSSPTTNTATLGSLLVLSVSQLLFCRGFTIPASAEGPLVDYVVWNKGIGATTAPPSSREEVIRRIEVSRLLQCLLSKCMYQPASASTSSGTTGKVENLWALEVAVKSDKKAVLGILCSFVNIISEFDPIGWAALPYNHLLFGSDVTETLVSICAQCLIALLDFQSETIASPIRPSESSESFASLSAISLPATSSTATGENLFTFYFSKLYKQQDFETMFNGITRLLQVPIDASKAYLPGSTKKIDLSQLLLVLLWFYIHANQKFTEFITQSPGILIVLQSLMTESLTARNDPRKMGDLRMYCFLLQVLSQNRGFAIQMNNPFDLSIFGPHARLFPNFSGGCWGDALYLFVYVLMTTNNSARQQITLLQESYLASLANCAPLITKFNPMTAQKLYSLFSVFSSPRFLLAKERNQTKLFYLLYTIDTILQYQYQGNVQIVYSFVRNKEAVLGLRDLTFESAIEIANKTLVKSAATNEGGEPGTPLAETPQLSPQNSSAALTTSVPPLRVSLLSEKAKGKMPANSSPSSSNFPYESLSGFRPTLGWWNEWKARLPIQVLATLVEKLGPQVSTFVVQHDLNVDTKVLEFLSTQTMVGVLPQPHPIITHAFIYSQPMHSWINAYVWGSFYMHSLENSNPEQVRVAPSIYAGTKVKLFGINNS